MSTDPVVIIVAAFVAVAAAGLVLLPVCLWTADGLVDWVMRGPRVLPAESESREVWVVTDGLDPYRYQTPEQVQAYHARNYQQWERRRKRWQRLYRLVARIVRRRR